MIHAHIFKIFYITFYSSHWIYFSCLIFRGTKQSFHSNICIGDLPLRRNIIKIIYWISSVQSFSRVRLFETPWIAPHQASVSITNSQSLPKLMSIEPVMPSSHLILCRPLLLLPLSLPASGSFPMSQLFTWGGHSIGVSALASFLPKNTRGWSPLEWSDWISLQSKGLSRVFSNTTVQTHQFFSAQLSSQSNSHIHTWPLEKP